MIRQEEDACDQNELIPITLKGVREENVCIEMCRFSFASIEVNKDRKK